MSNLYKYTMPSIVGDIVLLTSEKGLCFVGLPNIEQAIVDRFVKRNYPEATVMDDLQKNKRAFTQIKSYLDGKLTRFELDLDLCVDGFTREVLDVVARIPYGELRTYKEIAKAIGQPGAAQAVGNANGANPIPIIIPCHRVVASNGLGGYGGGLALKKKLLAIEQKDTLF
ncbi:MAG: methylated-DNA--[protein]-cysteine S-methyltransferase [Candidatus Zixiibacteriota bacterium]